MIRYSKHTHSFAILGTALGLASIFFTSWAWISGMHTFIVPFGLLISLMETLTAADTWIAELWLFFQKEKAGKDKPARVVS